MELSWCWIIDCPKREFKSHLILRFRDRLEGRVSPPSSVLIQDSFLPNEIVYF